MLHSLKNEALINHCFKKISIFTTNFGKKAHKKQLNIDKNYYYIKFSYKFGNIQKLLYLIHVPFALTENKPVC